MHHKLLILKNSSNPSIFCHQHRLRRLLLLLVLLCLLLVVLLRLLLLIAREWGRIKIGN
jgi:hypothetical protein